MQVNNKLLIALSIVILLVGYAYFGMGYVDQHKEHEALAYQITDVNQALAQLPQASPEIKQKLAAAQDSMDEEQSEFNEKLKEAVTFN